ncbi:malto-oligosyltrehalose synthase [Streptomyces albipurpureus]|uniref:Malto-oligosyltrehalose synthase n=1 Tax=Streptomyces albipurpureus TaxID=2897419 RepID=A0ABT0UG96_9ACTN|nr:malto-oligosyltrehalose synthase [Streptomyces sp. CWNU-1]MCM2387039.1 malto-oligosyltrehalose synthase [Streptomyces sp. CWNU-1]
MTPRATYRLQLQPAFPFASAAAAVPYLASLGISHLHLSPVWEAVPGSTHGYDITDPTRVREELGGEDGLRALASTARQHGLGLVLDLVPNHMAAVPQYNRAFWEALREGPSSPYARWFDIDWEAGGGRVLLPVLAGPIGAEINALKVKDAALHYGEQRFPLRAGTEGLPLPELLDAQWYRLGWWRLARTELTYRRFFTVSELIGVRVEDPGVFDATHSKVLELVQDGVVTGLRIDHPDGLADPEAYLRRLDTATGGACWTVVEKILTGDERLPPSWPVAGTTGYDSLRRIDGLFTDPVGAQALAAQFRGFADPAGDRGGYWEPTVRRAAHRVVSEELASETAALTRLAERVCAEDITLRDHAPWALRTAVRELLVRMPVYRPYGKGGEDVLTLRAAAGAKAAFAVPQESRAVDFVRSLALGRLGDSPNRIAFRERFAQTSSALRAKSVEDTAFYRYTPLISANEVGGDPGQPTISALEFHGHCARLARDWPTSGTVLTTHDTKRSADVRARIAVLSQCPERWEEFLRQITLEAADQEGGRAPDRQLAWAAWQTAVAVGFPAAQRLRSALVKGAREAALHTNWTEPNEAYEKAVGDFVDAGPAGPPLHSAALFARALAPHARANALGSTLLQLTMPGVPDLYQGTERTYLALVDPDNRSPFEEGTPDEKTALTRAALRLRSERPEAFGASGTYTPLEVTGRAAEHCVAYCRTGQVVAAVTRLSLRLERAGGWGDTEVTLPEGLWVDLLSAGRRLTGGPMRAADLFGPGPVALLVRAEG